MMSLLKQKVKPVAGDLLMENLGISEGDRKMLMNELDVIINCAASVNFDDHLHDAIRINFLGTLKMLSLAKSCHNLQSFTHVSTCYVNANRSDFIKECIYDLPNAQDPEEVIESLLKLDP